MDEREIHFQILKNNTVCLGDKLDVQPILNHLVNGDVLSVKEEAELRSMETQFKMADELIRKLMRKGRKEFNLFLRSLQQTLQRHLFDKLYLQLKEKDPEADLSDVLYEKLPPSAARRAMEVYEEHAEMVHAEITRLTEATQFLNGFLAASDLSLDTIKSSGVPLTLIEKSAKIRDMGGASFVTEVIADIFKLLRQSYEILAESDRLIANEEDTDTKLRQTYQSKWTIASSKLVTKPMMERSGVYKGVNMTQMTAIQDLEKRCSGLCGDIEILAQSDIDLENSLPPNAEGPSSNLTQEINRLMNDIDSIQTEREALGKEIHLVKEKIANKIIESLEERGSLDTEIGSPEMAEGLLAPLRERITKCVRQEHLLVDIKTIGSKFQEERGKNNRSQRDNKVQDLEAAFHSFEELKSEIQELSKLCNGEAKEILKHRDEVEELCCDRNSERAELLEAIQKTTPDPITEKKSTMSALNADQATTANQSWFVGDHKGSIWELNSNQNWESITKPYKSTLYSACSVPGGFIITGGHVNKKGTADCVSYQACTRVWKTLPSMTTGRYEHSSLCVDNKLYIIGGKSSETCMLNTAETLDLKANKWNSLRLLPRAVLSPFVLIASEKLFVLGGSESNSKYLCENYEHLSDLNVWQPRASMPNECRGGSAVSLHSNIYVVGGETKVCMQYSPSTDQWSMLAKPQLDHWRGPACVLNSKIIVCAGSKHSTIEEYDSEANTWSSLRLQAPKANRLHFALDYSSPI